MAARISLAASLLTMVVVARSLAQNPAPPATLPQGVTAPAPQPGAAPAGVPGWRSPAGGTAAPGGNGSSGLDAIEPIKPIARAPRRPLAQVSQGPATLPNEHGQVWREYNVSPYTLRVTATNRPEQAIVDWILRETGYEAWHSEPLGVLSANSRTIKVYHTPEMHAIVSDVVDRFVNSEAESHVFGLRVASVGSPNWRVKAHPMLHPVAVQSQGIQAWLVQKEDAALIIADMRRRSDYREHSSPQLVVNNGQSSTVSVTRARSYVRDVIPQPQGWPGYQNDTAQFDEGFTLELNPLLSLDGRTVDAVIKCNIDQLEKLVGVMIDVPTVAAPRQRTKIEVPQASHCRLHERFRWPIDQVLVIDFGVVPPPTPTEPGVLSNLPLVGAPARADLLVFVESKGQVTPPPTPGAGTPTTAGAQNYRGRY
ncbi:MAG TPA: hypothetical protein VHZ24_07795 [Pirellulales bacterium]|jgi:hypothetical protein|nr:hypothetical protein [Pirellulales bacterium]